jgi:hypothetical protein
VRARNGTPEAPYRSPTEALRALRSGQAPQVHTLFLRAGLYAPSTTQDAFPLDLSGLAHLTLRGADRATTVLDAEFRNDVVVAIVSQGLVIEDLTLMGGMGFWSLAAGISLFGGMRARTITAMALSWSPRPAP